MAYSRHGHLIPGTTAGFNQPEFTYRCGKFVNCNECKEDLTRHHGVDGPFINGEYKVSYPSPVEIIDYPTEAKKILVRYINREVVLGDDLIVNEDEVYVVWFCKTLQHWKAMLSTSLDDGKYYEMTYNGDKNEYYLDEYHKQNNQVLKPAPGKEVS